MKLNCDDRLTWTTRSHDFDRLLYRGPACDHPGVVNEDVDLGCALSQLGREIGDRLSVGKVEPVGSEPAIQCFDSTPDLAVRLLQVGTHADDVGTRPREGDRDAEADPPPTTGDDRGAAPQRKRVILRHSGYLEGLLSSSRWSGPGRRLPERSEGG